MSSSPPRGVAEGRTRDAPGWPAKDASAPGGAWRRFRRGPGFNALLFLLTVPSVLLAGSGMQPPADASLLGYLNTGWLFALPLLTILLAHEFGHYIAARRHGVAASLPYFLPAPLISPFGTLGALIVMPKRIRSATALVDIGAAGPLAGMTLAVPWMIVGLAMSPVMPVSTGGYVQEGQSLLYSLLKLVVFGPIPEGHDVMLHPTAYAAWAGFLVTFINLIPFGQLDGGHIAYALWGERQRRIAPWVRRGMLALAAYNFFVHLWPPIGQGLARGFESLPEGWWSPAGAVSSWLMLWALLWVLARVSGRDHPPVDDPKLSPGRRFVGYLSLAVFVAIFMPTLLVSYS